jgi:hypothetical protein
MNQAGAIRSGSVAFKPRARLLKLIGAELISDDVVAITELVKNAHDADASSVVIEFRGVTSADGEIVVRDDGSGMSLDALLRHWMEPAGTSKLGPNGRRTALGRRVLGEKGVGRFAADKLGGHLELLSRRRGEKDEVRAVFEWDRFEDETAMLTEVENHWEVRPPSEVASHGTVLRISKLRSQWSERMFRRLAARLSRLRSPFGQGKGFSIRIESDEFPEYSGDLRSDFLGQAPYRIEASFDGSNSVSSSVNGGRRSVQQWTDAPLGCGPVKIQIYAFDLETESIARIGPRIDVRAWLKEWSGVSVYRDGFRIWPYGEPHDDWLRLDQRRVNNPVVRLSNNQVVGFVEIGADSNPDLVDQTNREGLIHNPAFEDLRRLVHHTLQIVEAERQLLRHPAETQRGPSEPHPQSGGSRNLDAAFGRLVSKSPADLIPELRRFRERLDEELVAREGLHRQLEEGYAELATVGQAALGISSIVGPVLHDIVARSALLVSDIDRGAKGTLVNSARELLQSARMVSERVQMLAPLDGGSATNRRRAIDLVAEVESVLRTLEPILEARGVRMLVDPGTENMVRAELRPENFHRAMYVIVSALVDGLRHVRKPEIKLLVRGSDEFCELLMSDNGPGPRGNVGQAMLAALNGHRTLVREAMGMAAARSIVEANGGRMELVRDRRRRGTTIRVLLPRKRSRATLNYNT